MIIKQWNKVFLITIILVSLIFPTISAKSVLYNNLETTTTGGGSNITLYLDNGSTVSHNLLTDLQGGSAGEYYHIPLAWYNELNANLLNYVTQVDTDLLYAPISFGYNQTTATYNLYGSQWYNHTSSVNTLWGKWFYNTSSADQNYTDSKTNMTFNQSLTDSLYASITVVSDNASWNESYARTFAGGNLTFNQSLTNTLYSNIQWNYNQSSAIETLYSKWFYNMSTPFYSWLSTFNYNYNQTIPANSYTDSKTNMTFNQSLTDSLYASISSIGNASWNQSFASGLYIGSGNQTINGLINNASYLRTDNATYDSYATNVSLNYTKLTYDTYNSIWNTEDNKSWNQSYANELYAPITFVGGNNSWNQSFANTLYSNIQWNYNQSSAIETLYSKWFYNMSTPFYSWLSTFNYNYNQTLAVYNLYNTQWSDTHNVTYDSYASNVSRNWTANAETYTNLINTTLTARIDNLVQDNRSWNESYARTFLGDNASWNESNANTLYIGSGNQTINGLINNASYLRTDNATYDSYATNVSRNWTSDSLLVCSNISWNYNATNATFTIWNSTWDNRGTILLVLSQLATNISTVNTSTNVQQLYNYTSATYNAYDARWSNTSNVTYDGLINNASYLSTYNSTYASYSTNVSRNYTNEVYTNWGSWFYNMTTAVYTLFGSVWSQNIALTNASEQFDLNVNVTGNLTVGSGTTYLDIYDNGSSILFSTSNSSIFNKGLNVSSGDICISGGNCLSKVTGDNASWNQSMANNIYQINYTYNSTYASYSTNVSRNWTNDGVAIFSPISWGYNMTTATFTLYNTSWDSRWLIVKLNNNVTSINTSNNIQQLYNTSASQICNMSINLSVAMNSSYITTYNATYASYSTNVSRNWTNDGVAIFSPISWGYNMTSAIFSLFNTWVQNQTFQNDTIMRANQSIYMGLNNQRITSNDSCIIIKGKASTMEIC